jgi:hypothetical protein
MIVMPYIKDLLGLIVWRKRALEATSKSTEGTMDLLDLRDCTWASSKGMIDVLMNELGRRGFCFWDATVVWSKDVVAGESDDDDDMQDFGVPGRNGKVFWWSC